MLGGVEEGGCNFLALMGVGRGGGGSRSCDEGTLGAICGWGDGKDDADDMDEETMLGT